MKSNSRSERFDRLMGIGAVVASWEGVIGGGEEEEPIRVDGEEMLSRLARLEARRVVALLVTREEVLGLRKCRREATVSRLWLILRSRKLPKLDEIVESRFRFLLG